MSTHNTSIQDQEAPPQAPDSFYREETLQRENLPPPTNFPPPRRTSRDRRNFWFAIAAVIVVLALIASVLALVVSLQGQQPATQVTPTPTAPKTTVTTTPGGETTPNPTQVVTPVPPPFNTPAHWDRILGTAGTNGKVESVSFAQILGNASLQALVTVRHSDANSTLDVYVFDRITSATPTQLFKLSGLIKGDAKFSGYNSIMTAQVDQNSSINVSQPAKQWTADLFREFDWSASKGTMVQVAFPGIFPDLTRYQAEADQALVNKGQDTWKNDPAQVAKALASDVFNWTRALTTKVLSGGGPRDVSATVQVQEAPVPGGPKQAPTATVTLSRLEGNTQNMWVATAVQDDTGTLTNIPARSLIASPVRLEGKGSAFEGVIGQAFIFDHTKFPIGHAIITGTPGMGYASYSIAVSYDTSFKAGPQEGIVGIEFTSPVEADPYSYVMVKVLLDPQPNVALGPVSCPVALQQPGYWESQFGISPATVTCGNLKGPAYSDLLALVTVSPSGSKPGHLYVYDLTHTPPVQLFSLQTNDAKISGESTITTKDGNVYREYAWSGNGFVQVAFPGMFPDLTRWQADADQALVNQGQDTWKRDALKTAQHFVAQFLPSSNPAKLELVFGGGSHDPQAYVNVSFPGEGNSTPPVTKITLSRLGGYATTGIWEVTSVGSDWLFIYTPKSGTRITSPVTVTGFGPQFEAQIGTVYILDRLYQKIQVGDNYAMAPDGSSPPSKFSLDVPYTSSVKGGIQEGIVELAHSGGPSFESGIVLVKVLIGG